MATVEAEALLGSVLRQFDGPAGARGPSSDPPAPAAPSKLSWLGPQLMQLLLEGRVAVADGVVTVDRGAFDPRAVVRD